MAIGARIGRRVSQSPRPPGRPDPVVLAERIALHYPVIEDYPAWAGLRAQSRDFLTPWEPAWPEDELLKSAFRRRLRLYARAIRAEDAHPFFVIRRGDNRLLGGLTISNIRRGVTQAGTLGYWVGAPYACNGYMTEAVRAALRFCFGRLALHRVEAATLPDNQPSRRLLTACGFQEEGYARRYLKINGIWQDHVLYAILDSDARA
jgi:ribosomal-protein-alanine N-acetyltransferase